MNCIIGSHIGFSNTLNQPKPVAAKCINMANTSPELTRERERHNIGEHKNRE